MFVARFCLVAIAAVSLCVMHPGPAVSRGFGTSRTYVVISGPIMKSSPTVGAETSVAGPEKTKVEERQGQSQSLIRDCFVVIRLRLLTIARAEESWSDGLRRLIP